MLLKGSNANYEITANTEDDDSFSDKSSILSSDCNLEDDEVPEVEKIGSKNLCHLCKEISVYNMQDVKCKNTQTSAADIN